MVGVYKRCSFLFDSSLNPTNIEPMESTLSATTATAVFGLSKTLNHSVTGAQTLRSQLALFHIRRTTIATKAEFRRSSSKFASAYPLFGLRNVGGGVPLLRYRVECVSSSASAGSFASLSGGGGIGGGAHSEGGGGGGGGDGGEVKVNPIVTDATGVSSDVIILDVFVSIYYPFSIRFAYCCY